MKFTASLTAIGGATGYWKFVCEKLKIFCPSRFVWVNVCNLYLENYFISRLNEFCKRKETPRNGYLESSRLVWWPHLLPSRGTGSHSFTPCGRTSSYSALVRASGASWNTWTATMIPPGMLALESDSFDAAVTHWSPDWCSLVWHRGQYDLICKDEMSRFLKDFDKGLELDCPIMLRPWIPNIIFDQKDSNDIYIIMITCVENIVRNLYTIDTFFPPIMLTGENLKSQVQQLKMSRHTSVGLMQCYVWGAFSA